jgi:phytoene synthase
MAMLATTIQDAYTEVERRVRARSRTFRHATALLPPDQRTALRVAYCFFRTIDDLVDSGHATSEKLQELCRQVIRPAEEQTDPVLMAWADVRERYAVNPLYVTELLDGIASDLTPRRFETLDELWRYCYHVASTAGLMIVPIIGLKSGVSFETAAPYAVRLGMALQFTNILRDVDEDLRQDRLYLPLSEMSQFGLTEADLRARVVDGRFKQLMKRLIAVNRTLYTEAWPGIGLLSGYGQWAVGLGAISYRTILDEIERMDYDVLTCRASPGRLTRLGALLTQWPQVAWPR